MLFVVVWKFRLLILNNINNEIQNEIIDKKTIFLKLNMYLFFLNISDVKKIFDLDLKNIGSNKIVNIISDISEIISDRLIEKKEFNLFLSNIGPKYSSFLLYFFFPFLNLIIV